MLKMRALFARIAWLGRTGWIRTGLPQSRHWGAGMAIGIRSIDCCLFFASRKRASGVESTFACFEATICQALP